MFIILATDVEMILNNKQNQTEECKLLQGNNLLQRQKSPLRVLDMKFGNKGNLTFLDLNIFFKIILTVQF